jgi:membrane associated rhomboid family serine protease
MSDKNGADGKDGSGERRNNIIDIDKIRAKLQEKIQKNRPASSARAEPMFNLPPYTKALLGFFILVHIVITLVLSPEQRYTVYETFGFIPGYYSGMMDAFGWEPYYGPLCYMFLHGNWFHLAVNGVMLMAFGAAVENWIGGRRMLVLFYLSALAAAAAHYAFNMHSTNPVIGASGGESGLFAAALVMMKSSERFGFGGRGGVWPFVALWVIISILFGLTGSPDGSSVAWQAHLGGFLAGFVLFRPVMKYVR